jgi:hypothetical protein
MRGLLLPALLRRRRLNRLCGGGLLPGRSFLPGWVFLGRLGLRGSLRLRLRGLGLGGLCVYLVKAGYLVVKGKIIKNDVEFGVGQSLHMIFRSAGVFGQYSGYDF